MDMNALYFIIPIVVLIGIYLAITVRKTVKSDKPKKEPNNKSKDPIKVKDKCFKPENLELLSTDTLKNAIVKLLYRVEELEKELELIKNKNKK